jgi:protease-4
VFASEQIWRAIKRAASKKPVIISMGDVAASGGYYAAVAGHTIFAQRNTITGSIGIFMVKPDISGLLEKIGVHRENYSAGEHADWESIEHGMTDTDQARLLHTLENYYSIFVGRVGAGRHMSTDDVRKIAEGHVYTGEHAKQLGLVDEIGGLDDAILLACERAGIDRHEAQIDIPDRFLSMPELARRLVGISTLAQTPLQSVEEELMSKVRAADGRFLAIMPEAYTVSAP